MADIEKVIKGLECCSTGEIYHNDDCPYGRSCCYGCNLSELLADALALLKEREEERKRMISWLGKFCRHIDNGDKWLSDEENIAFFREKMKQQFGWDS